MSSTPESPPAATPPATPATPFRPHNSGRRRRLLVFVTVIFVFVLAGYGVWREFFAGSFESTDDAYVAGNVVQVTPQVAGTVVAIHADDTERVSAGQPLVDLDATDAAVALRQAEAQLAQTVREVRTLFVGNNSLDATIAVREADLQRARADLTRREGLAGTGAVSREDIAHAQSAVQAAEAALRAAREQLATNRVLTERTSVAAHPNVRRAAAQVEAAYLAVARMRLPAPVTGFVARRSVQVGQRVAPGAPLLSIVPLEGLWVDANFKEVQLAQMRVGQPVTLRADVYGSQVSYHGRVAGFSAGTGSAFALLPAQNASGNWIKVVQRLPVRIALDPKELADHPLRVGLSMSVKVDVADSSGSNLASAAPRTEPAYSTRVFDAAGKEAAALIARIIADNAGSDGVAAPPARVRTAAPKT